MSRVEFGNVTSMILELLTMSWCAFRFLSKLLFATTLLHSVTGGARADERNLQVPGPLGPLEGTYLSVGSPISPPVLIIPGSGPTDRDGNSPPSVTASTYKYFARGLAEAGISSIRVDKRGMFGSRSAVNDANDVTLADYADDVHSWIKVVQKETGAHCVWLLGHSEGGLVALVSAQREGLICGLILVASPGRPFGEILRKQLRDNPANGPLLDDALNAIKSLELGQKVNVTGFHPALQQLFSPQVQGFMMDLMSYDPETLVSNVSVPVLILQGERDLQITEQDARRLHKARPDAHLAVLPQTNHILKQVKSADRSANLATYANPSLPLAPGVVEAVVNFVKGQKENE